MDTLNLHSHFENLLYVGRSVLTNTSSRIRRLFFKNEMCIYEYLFMEEVNKGIEIVVDNAVLVCVLEMMSVINLFFILMIQSILHLILIIVIVILSIIKPLTSGLCLMVILVCLYLLMILRSDLLLYKL